MAAFLNHRWTASIAPTVIDARVKSARRRETCPVTGSATNLVTAPRRRRWITCRACAASKGTFITAPKTRTRTPLAPMILAPAARRAVSRAGLAWDSSAWCSPASSATCRSRAASMSLRPVTIVAIDAAVSALATARVGSSTPTAAASTRGRSRRLPSRPSTSEAPCPTLCPSPPRRPFCLSRDREEITPEITNRRPNPRI